MHKCWSDYTTEELLRIKAELQGMLNIVKDTLKHRLECIDVNVSVEAITN